MEIISVHQSDLGVIGWDGSLVGAVEMHMTMQTTLFGLYVIVKEPFPLELQVSPTWKTSPLFVMSLWHPVFLSSPLPQPPSGSLPSHLKLCSYSEFCSTLSSLFIVWSISISSPLPLQIVDGGAVFFHYRHMPPLHPSSHLHAGLDSDISEQLLVLPLCPRFRKNSDSSTKQKWIVLFPWPCVLCLTHPHLHQFSACFHSASFVCMSDTRGGSQDVVQPSSSPRRKVDRSDPKSLLNANWQVAGVKEGWWHCRALPAGRESGCQIGTHSCSLKLSTTARILGAEPSCHSPQSWNLFRVVWILM